MINHKFLDARSKCSFFTELAFNVLLSVLFFCLPATTWAQNKISPVPNAIRSQFELDNFYQKYIDAYGMPVVGSKNVNDFAILEAHWIVKQMVGHRPEILKAMAKNSTRLAVMAHDEYTTDVPEHRHLKSRVYWDRRARGLGATRRAPAVSCAEENLLCYPNDPYSTENICIHEFAHAIHSMGMIDVDPTFDKRLKDAFEDAKSKGLWKDTYAMSNHSEYWAEATQSWFDNNRANDELHNDINTREKLKKYDPNVARLCEQVFGDREWRYKKPGQRKPQGRSHLEGFAFTNLPKFKWRKHPVGEKPEVLIETTLGDIELELDALKAPKTVASFLDYVHEGVYSNGEFYRILNQSNQPNNKIKIAVVQARSNPARAGDLNAPIVLERTRDTGLKHLNGTISMAREDPDSARDEFFFCLGDQPELDFGGKRNPDGQGFAAFGRITKGMEILKKIHESTAEEQTLRPAIKIQRAIRLR